MKKIILIALVAVMMCLFTACGCDDNKAGEDMVSDVTKAVSDMESDGGKMVDDAKSMVTDAVSDMTGGEVSDGDGIIGNEGKEDSSQGATEADITM